MSNSTFVLLAWLFIGSEDEALELESNRLLSCKFIVDDVEEEEEEEEEEDEDVVVDDDDRNDCSKLLHKYLSIELFSNKF
jgi:hypothetical protein